MQEISRILIEARNAKGVDIEQASHDTNIAKMFLQGLETDNYKDFPAEAYVLGFLRNYATYLELDAEQVVKLYKQTKLQESEIPQEVILNKKPLNVKALIIGLVSVSMLVLIAVAAFLIWKTFIKLPNKGTASKIETVQPPAKTETTESGTTVIDKNTGKNYEISTEYYENRFFEGDTFSLNLGETTYIFTIKKTLGVLELETEKQGTQIAKLGESISLDLNDDAVSDVEIAVGDIDKTDATKGVLLTITTGQNVARKTDTVSETNANATKNYVTIFEGASAYPVTMNITFRNYCFFRYEIDRKNRKEQYQQKNATLSLRADNGFRIWASNGNALKIELIGAGRTVDVPLTKPGEVTVQDIKWIKDDTTNRYKFVIIDVD
jgi:hypothetical protein